MQVVKRLDSDHVPVHSVEDVVVLALDSGHRRLAGLQVGQIVVSVSIGAGDAAHEEHH